MTHRLNQDALENMFGTFRRMGGLYDHPSPLAVKHRVKSYLLTRQSPLLGNKRNTEKDDAVTI